jgi:hypothetical protein
MRGEFGPPERQTLFYLPAHLPTYEPFWVLRTGMQVAGMRAHNHDETPDLWAPRSLCAKWLAARQLPLPPWLAEQANGATPHPPTAAVRTTRRSVPIEKVNEWYKCEAERAGSQGVKLNRDETIQRCQDETGCNRDMAREGLKTVPAGVRNDRGAPKKNKPAIIRR